ncbi:MAG: hypothetical protein U1E05_14555, partial [Patescibacteria group bacterium]|nr:hypothetical protein [Patescibacteria group bacterium]
MKRMCAFALLTLLFGACTPDRPAGDEPRPRPGSVQQESPTSEPIPAASDASSASAVPEAPAEPAGSAVPAEPAGSAKPD